MILITKKQAAERPQAYLDWLLENQTEIEQLEADPRSPSALWNLLGKTLSEHDTQIDPYIVRYELHVALYEEQGGICCYCGDRLRRNNPEREDIEREFPNQSIEHFKGKSRNRSRMFNYENLLLCCKNSSNQTKFKIGYPYRQRIISNWEDVAAITELPVEKIKEFKSNRHLRAKDDLKVGDTIHVPNPPHCDDEKSKFDEKPPNLIIIDPARDGHLIEKLTYDSEGNIGAANTTDEERAVIEKTIEVLGLGIEKLNKKRKDVWGRKAFEEKYAESLAAINEAALSPQKHEEVLRKLIEKSLERDESGLLAPFCFVEYASLKAMFGF